MSFTPGRPLCTWKPTAEQLQELAEESARIKAAAQARVDALQIQRDALQIQRPQPRKKRPRVDRVVAKMARELRALSPEYDQHRALFHARYERDFTDARFAEAVALAYEAMRS